MDKYFITSEALLELIRNKNATVSIHSADYWDVLASLELLDDGEGGNNE
jgi:hypothetical protein